MSTHARHTHTRTNRPLFSVLHAAKRIPQCFDIWRAWSAACQAQSEVEYIIAVHESDAQALVDSWDEVLNRHESGIPVRVVVNPKRDCCVDNWNRAAEAADGQILIVCADDLYPPAEWDVKFALAAITRCKPDSEFLLHVGTGSPSDAVLITHPIFSRKLYDRWGYVFWPEYESMYADNDTTERARREGVIVNCLDVFTFDHRCAVLGKVPWDEVARKQNSTEAHKAGREIFERRLLEGFGAAEPAQPIRQAVAVCLPGEIFSDVWVAHWTSLFAELQCRYSVAATFGYSSNVYMTRGSIADNLLTSGQVFDYVLWLDDDNTLRYDQFEMLKRDLDENPELDGVVGWCWIQPDNYGIEPCVSCGRIVEEIKSVPFTFHELMSGPADLVPIEYSGFPVVLLRFATLKRAGKNPFAAVRDDRLSWGMSGEDFAFFLHARANGCKFAVDRRVKVPHFKRRPAEPDMRAYEGVQIVGKPDGSEPITLSALPQEAQAVS